MLRQAQESALKIRTDAEIEARTLVDQVRLDIETDRAAHEQAASELINRTEEQATRIRTDAEIYASETRRAADEYAAGKREEAEKYQRDSEIAADADRKLAVEKLESAKREAEATIANANERAAEIVSSAEGEARTTSERILGQATSTLEGFADAERQSRSSLEAAKTAIESALTQLRVSEIQVPSVADVTGSTDADGNGDSSAADEVTDAEIVDDDSDD